MHGILIEPSPTVSIVAQREGVEVFGGADPAEPVRVEVRVRMCLSFAEIMGLMLFTSGVCLTFEELEDDDVLRDTLQFALIETDLRALEINGYRAMAEYRSALAGRLAGPDKSPLFVGLLAAAVTRVFGVAA
ncbi:hypothetical protein ACWC3X_18960 [Streptomyces populi]